MAMTTESPIEYSDLPIVVGLAHETYNSEIGDQHKLPIVLRKSGDRPRPLSLHCRGADVGMDEGHEKYERKPGRDEPSRGEKPPLRMSSRSQR